MIVKSINDSIRERPGYEVKNCGCEGSFFYIEYVKTDEVDPSLIVYFNSDGKEVFEVFNAD